MTDLDKSIAGDGPVVDVAPGSGSSLQHEQVSGALVTSLQSVISAADEAGVDVRGWTFQEIAQLVAGQREYQALAHADIEKAKEKDREVKRQRLEDRVRFTLALILTVGAVGGIVAGITANIPAEQLTQFLAPITGLAGIAIGYFFGRQAR